MGHPIILGERSGGGGKGTRQEREKIGKIVQKGKNRGKGKKKKIVFFVNILVS